MQGTTVNPFSTVSPRWMILNFLLTNNSERKKYLQYPYFLNVSTEDIIRANRFLTMKVNNELNLSHGLQHDSLKIQLLRIITKINQKSAFSDR